MNALHEGREIVLNGFKSGIFLLPPTEGRGLKISAHNEMLQILLIALAQVKAGNTSEELLNEIYQIIYSVYQGKNLLKTYITE